MNMDQEQNRYYLQITTVYIQRLIFLFDQLSGHFVICDVDEGLCRAVLGLGEFKFTVMGRNYIRDCVFIIKKH